jgi:hypothetical protein
LSVSDLLPGVTGGNRSADDGGVDDGRTYDDYLAANPQAANRLTLPLVKK